MERIHELDPTAANNVTDQAFRGLLNIDEELFVIVCLKYWQ